jgi:hypothetical protein
MALIMNLKFLLDHPNDTNFFTPNPPYYNNNEYSEEDPCRNPSLGLMTKARGCKVAGQEGSSGVMPHALGSARECEGIDLHTSKGTPLLGVGVLVDSRMFRE